jgi:hypothetical protein
MLCCFQRSNNPGLARLIGFNWICEQIFETVDYHHLCTHRRSFSTDRQRPNEPVGFGLKIQVMRLAQ